MSGDFEMNAAILKEIKKQVHKVSGSHLGTVKNALLVQFPSIDTNEWADAINSEFKKKYDNVEIKVKARF